MATLKIENLSIKFGGIQALRNVSLEVPPNSFVGLMGPNGAGKTTIINCISRIYKPESGLITFDGCDLMGLSGDKILELGIARTFQDLNFFNRISNMMIIDYLKLGQHRLNLHSSNKKTTKHLTEADLKRNARRILEFFRYTRELLEPPEKERGYPYLYGREGFPDLIDVEYKPISLLSFAWRRRLDLARALVSNPRLLLLDEPAQGLPRLEIENLGKTLKLIQAEFGISALIVEHNIATLSEISDKVVAMNLGEKIAEGLPEVVNKDPKVIEVYLGTSAAADKVAFRAPKEENEVRGAPLLELRNVDHYYGSAQALFGVSLKIFSGEITSILGTNGSGKSTILKVISGSEKPTVGEILFKGEVIPLGWPEVLVERGIQFVPQGHVIFPELSVFSNLEIGAHLFKKNGLNFKQELDRVLDYFPTLKDCLKSQAASLSGGQQQMLAIGQAIMNKPELLLLDEPSLGLSPTFVNKLFDIICKISDNDNCSVVLVEQNAKKAIEVSDYVYMMSSGVLIGESSSKYLKNNDDILIKNLGFH